MGMTVEISKDDLILVIKVLEESNNLLQDNGYKPNEMNISLLNRLKLKVQEE